MMRFSFCLEIIPCQQFEHLFEGISLHAHVYGDPAWMVDLQWYLSCVALALRDLFHVGILEDIQLGLHQVHSGTSDSPQ